MPEIAEVELLRRQLQSLVGAQIVNVEATDPKLNEVEGVQGQVVALCRHGKLLGLGLEDGTVLSCHLRMTGALTFVEQPHNRATIHFADRRNLYFSDPRRFGILQLQDRREFGTGLGPDLLDEPELLAGRWSYVQRQRRPIKAVLLDQHVLAGIGNYLADESLYACRIHPFAPAWLLGESTWKELVSAARAVALQTLELGGVSLRDYKQADGSPGHGQTVLRCYGRRGLPCERCGTPLEQLVVAGRGSTICPHCQAQEITYTNYRGETARRVAALRCTSGSAPGTRSGSGCLKRKTSTGQRPALLPPPTFIAGCPPPRRKTVFGTKTSAERLGGVVRRIVREAGCRRTRRTMLRA